MRCEFPYLRPVLLDSTEVDMTNRRLMLAALGAVSLIEPLRTALTAEVCPPDCRSREFCAVRPLYRRVERA